MGWIHDNVWLIGRFTSVVNTAKILSFGLGKASKVVKKNRWTLRTLSGLKLRVWFPWTVAAETFRVVLEDDSSLH